MGKHREKPTENTGNKGQHKATGKAGVQRLENQKAMERIRRGLTGK